MSTAAASAAPRDRGGAPSRAPRPAALAGTWPLIRLILRRDRVRLPVWITAIAATVLGSAAGFQDFFPTEEDVATRIALIQGNPAGVALTGPGYGLEDASLDNFGPMVASELSTTTIVLFALMSLLLLVRHTRTEEESGRAELVRAGVVGRHAPLTAALAVIGGANLLLGALLAAGLYGMDFPGPGSVAFGVSMAAVGLLFTAVAAAAAQITEYGRAAAGIAGAAFALAFLVRTVGDVRESDLSWASPLGWAQAMRPYADERWWPLLLLLGLAVLFLAAAYLLNARRDLGAGFLRPGTGRATASPLLSGPFALAFRAQRGALLAWGAGLLGGGLAGGAIAAEAEILAEMEIYQEFMHLGDGGLVEQVIGFYLLFLALIAGGYTLQTVLRARAEETAGRAEPVLAAAVSRRRWAGSHLLTALLGTVIVLLAGGLGTAAVHELQGGEGAGVLEIAAASLVYLPALGLLAGIAFALIGLLPRAAGAAWLPLAYALFIAMFGPLFGLPDWMFDLSPFTHIPEMPGEEFAAAPVLWLSGAALVLIAAGFWGIGRRDLDTA